MKKLRKIAALLVAAALVFGTAACSSDDDDDDTPTSNYKSETGGDSGSGSGSGSGNGSGSGTESGSGSETGGGSEEKTQPTLSSIAVKKNPKTTYVVNDDLDLTGLVITLNYSDNTTKEVTYSETSGITAEADLSAAGTKTVTVTYNEKSTTFEVTVNEGTYNYTGTGSYIKIAEYSEIKKYEKVTVTVNGPYIWAGSDWFTLNDGSDSYVKVDWVSGKGNSTLYKVKVDASKFPNGLYMGAAAGCKCNVSLEGSGTAPNGDVSIGIE